MPAKKKKTTTKSRPKRTAKRRTAIPATKARASFEPVRMRLAEAPPVDEIEPTHETIARRSYEIWERKLTLANDSLRNWLEAESQLRTELNGVRF